METWGRNQITRKWCNLELLLKSGKNGKILLKFKEEKYSSDGKIRLKKVKATVPVRRVQGEHYFFNSEMSKTKNMNIKNRNKKSDVLFTRKVNEYILRSIQPEEMW